MALVCSRFSYYFIDSLENEILASFVHLFFFLSVFSFMVRLSVELCLTLLLVSFIVKKSRMS